MDDEKMLTRRHFAAAAAGAAGALALAGCVPQRKEGTAQPVQDTAPEQMFNLNKDFLPLGSIVRLDDASEGVVSLMVVSRLPYSPDGEQYDYLGAFYPFGIMPAEEDAPIQDVAYFDAEEISEIMFLGYSDLLEEEANRELQAGAAEGVPNYIATAGLMLSYFDMENTGASDEDLVRDARDEEAALMESASSEAETEGE